MMLPIIKHALIYKSELKQQFLQDTNVLSHIPKIQKFADITLTRTNTKTVKVVIKPKCLDTKSLAATTVKIMFVIFLDLPHKQYNRTVEPPKPIAFLTDSDQQESIRKVQGKLQIITFDPDIYGIWVYSPQSKYKTWISEAS